MVSVLKNPSNMSTLSQTTTTTTTTTANGVISLKRGAALINESPPPRAVKRVRICDPAGNTPMDRHLTEEMMRKHVQSALEEKNAGKESTKFEYLRKQFTIHPSDDQAPSSTELRNILKALTYVVANLTKPCSDLVYGILSTNWAGREEAFFTSYMSFVMQLVSAHSTYVYATMKMLVKHLTRQPLEIGRIPGCSPVARMTIFERTHIAMKRLLELVPTAYAALFDAVQNVFPHKDEKRIYQTTFMTNLFRILDYAPESRTKIMGLIFDKIMAVDVEIQISADDLGQAEGERLDMAVQAQDDADVVEKARARIIAELGDEGDDEDEDDEDDEDEEGQDSVKKIKETIEKLDAMLEITFVYFATLFPECPVELPDKATLELFELLQHFFDNTVLSTYKSKYTQFVLFWASQKSPHLADRFMGMLMNQALNLNDRSQITRITASAYTASYLARAKTLTRLDIRKAVSLLCEYLDKTLDEKEKACVGADVGRYGLFYAVTQAVMYIFCFRWRDLKGLRDEIHEDEDETGPTGWHPSLNLFSRLILSKFNPLKVCAPIVVHMFADLTREFGIVYCDSIIEANRRADFHNTKSQRSDGSGKPEDDNTQLKPFFPFDPYNLPVSRTWIDKIYNDWHEVKRVQKRCEEPGNEKNENDKTDNHDDSDASGSEDNSDISDPEDEDNAEDSESEDDEEMDED